jgi:hypothetical protein
MAGAGSSSTTTDSSGNYIFTGAFNGSYSITPSMLGFTFSPTISVTVNNANVTGVSFTASPANSSTLSGNLNFANYKAIAMACDNGATLPSNPVTGQWFLYTPPSRKVLMQYIDSAWVPIMSVGPMVLYVDNGNTTGTPGTNDQSHGTAPGNSAFLTIQYAVDQLPGLLDGGVLILIAPGTYNESVTLVGKNEVGNNAIEIWGYDASGHHGLTALKSGKITSGTQGAGVSATAISGLPGSTFVVGQTYMIKTYVAGDNLTNIGAPSNASGAAFVATGTTPTIWTNGSTVISAGQGTVFKKGEFAPVVYTTCNGISAAGQATLNINTPTGIFNVGDTILINSGGATQETAVIKSVTGSPATAIVACANLKYAHSNNETIAQCQYAGKLLYLATLDSYRVIDYHTSDKIYVTLYNSGTPSASEAYTIYDWGTIITGSTSLYAMGNTVDVGLSFVKLAGSTALTVLNGAFISPSYSWIAAGSVVSTYSEVYSIYCLYSGGQFTPVASYTQFLYTLIRSNGAGTYAINSYDSLISFYNCIFDSWPVEVLMQQGTEGSGSAVYNIFRNAPDYGLWAVIGSNGSYFMTYSVFFNSATQADSTSSIQ